MVVVGGMSVDTNPKDYLMQYDPDTDRWKMLPSMPTPRYATFSFLIANKLYVIGASLTLRLIRSRSLSDNWAVRNWVVVWINGLNARVVIFKT